MSQAAPAHKHHVFVKRGVRIPATAPRIARDGGPYTQRGTTPNFNVFFENALGASGPVLADAVLANCERDYAALQGFFGAITPPGLPFNVYVVTGDFGAYHASNVKNSGLDLTVVTFLFGPRISYRKQGPFTPYAQVLLGGGHAGGSLYQPPPLAISGPHYALAMSLGGGLDLKVHPRVAIRLFQAEWLYTKFNNGVNDRQNSMRVTTGLVFRFGSR